MSAVCRCWGLVIDLFAGGGGAGHGVQQALGTCHRCGLPRIVDLAVNHWYTAIRNYGLNAHSKTRLVSDNVRKLVPIAVTGGQPVSVLWASPDCKHFSRAKSGKPCDDSVRSLAWEIVTWAQQCRPGLICIENVPEFLDWGPLYQEHSGGCEGTERCNCGRGGKPSKKCKRTSHCRKGCSYMTPIKEAKGTTFDAWAAELRALGYSLGHRMLKASSYGAPTSRKRFFLCARADGQPIQWPEPTHGPGLERERTAAECIDWSDLGISVFETDPDVIRAARIKRPLADATCRRIAHGLVKYVLQAKDPFLVRDGQAGATLLNTSNGERKGQAPRSWNPRKPLPTITASGSGGALAAVWLAQHNTGEIGHDPRKPLSTITATPQQGICAASLGGPGDRSRAVAAFITTYYGQSVGQDVRKPLATVTTHDRFGLVSVEIDGERHVVTDITMRMLKPEELKVAQGFPADYRLDANDTDKKRLIGNSVPPQLSRAVVEANLPTPQKRAVA